MHITYLYDSGLRLFSYVSTDGYLAETISFKIPQKIDLNKRVKHNEYYYSTDYVVEHTH